VKLIRLDEGDEIAAITKLSEHEADEDMETSQPLTDPSHHISTGTETNPTTETDLNHDETDTSTEEEDF
jgi:DNA gyrase subunit A